jgi:hypothetical protein
MSGFLRRLYKKILYAVFGKNSGCCKIPNKSELTNDIQQKSYVDSKQTK